MRYLRIILLTILVAIPGLSYARDQQTLFIRTLEKLFDRIRQNLPLEMKLAANDSIMNMISIYAASDNVFKTQFKSLRYLGQITSPDTLVKLITWNIVMGEGSGEYHCFIVSRKQSGDKPAVIRLKAEYRERPPGNGQFGASDWYGALYYDLRPFLSQGRLFYALIGIDYGNPFITRKIIDVLDIVDPLSPKFGLECFTDGKTTRNRIVFEYSSSALMSLRFESNSLIVFDHLSPFSPEFRGNFQFYGPDFTFDSFNFVNGSWRLNSDIDIKNKEKR